MVHYINNIILPYVKSVRQQRQDSNAAALVIVDNFMITDTIHTLLEQNNILVALLPPNKMDLLKPLDIAVNKPVLVTEILKIGILVKFLSSWKDRTLLLPVDLSLPVMRDNEIPD